jgi:hypothetical protein
MGKALDIDEVSIWNRYNWLRSRPVESFFPDDNESSGFHKEVRIA